MTLALTRKINQSLHITIPPSDVERKMVVSIAKVHGKQITLGIDASKEITVLRGELLNQSAKSESR